MGNRIPIVLREVQWVTEMKIYVHTKTFTCMFIAVLLTIAPNRKQPKCPCMDEWINTMWFIHTIEYYLAVKTTRIMLQHG